MSHSTRSRQSHSQQRPSLSLSSPRTSYLTTATPSVSLSPLTTRSSSSTRLSQLQPQQQQQAAEGPNEAYRAWRRDSKQLLQLQQQRGGVKSRNNKSKAVAFVVGAPSSGSGEEADEERDHHDAEGEQGDDELEERARSVAWAMRVPTLQQLIQQQVRQPTYNLPPLNLDPLLPLGIADYTFVLAPPSTSASADNSPKPEPTSSSPTTTTTTASEPPPPHPRRVSLGKGKFSEVLLARKGGVEYALKHTPLHPHHPLIATRLLREPTILAQLLPHPNLVKVFETIRTPGHFYLVEESLQSSITLEALVASQPGGVLPIGMAWSVLEQLTSVVRSLHEPLRVCHRDIKPENILVRVTPSLDGQSEPTLLLKLLDFGLATHFSASEPKLTTCCGSPAYHSPELWRGLREKSGSVRYWGPEVDIWCTALTLLRCLTPHKYPLGINHSSLLALGDKVVDALLAVEDEGMRDVLRGMLSMDGEGRMRAFEEYAGREEVLARARFEEQGAGGGTPPPTPGPQQAHLKAQKKEFKSTDFLPQSPLFSLDLPLAPTNEEAGSPSSSDPEDEQLGGGGRLHALQVQVDPLDEVVMAIRSRSPSRSRPRPSSRKPTAVDSSPPPPPDLTPDPYSPRPLEGGDSSLPTTPRTPSMNPFAVAREREGSPFGGGGGRGGPPPATITLLNPTSEPIRRATSYIKYALRCKGVLYHVREVEEERVGLGVNAARDGEEEEDEEGYTTFLQCVLKLPAVVEGEEDGVGGKSRASSALIAALAGGGASAGMGGAAGKKQRPAMVRAQTMGNPRSASTPAPGGKTGKKEAEQPVRCTTVLLAIRAGASPSSEDPRARRRSRSRKTSHGNSTSPTIVLTLSDSRALPVVREALRIDLGGATSVGAAVSDGERGRLARGAAAGGVGRSPNAGSGSRDARLRRAATSFVGGVGGGGGQQVEGLAMSMGPPSALPTPSGGVGEPKKGFFDYVGGLGGRWGGFMTPGGGSSRGASGIETPEEREGEGEGRRREVPVVAFV